MSDKQPDPKVVNLNAPAQPQPQPQPRQDDRDFFAKVVDATVQEIEARGPRISPFDLTSHDDVVRFAEHTARSGLCPKEFKGKPDDIISAVLWGKELGLPAMSSLMSIAVINGRAAIWGEAVAALCYRTRLVENVEERFQGEGDELTAICVVKRKHIESPKVGSFSVADARTAGLFGQNVHKTYPRDMLMWKARHRAWHAAFPDTLRGLGTAEIAQEEAQAEAFQLPRPAHSWFVIRPQYQGGHDVTWLNATEEALRSERNAWEWMARLKKALLEAPTLRDVDEVISWPMTAETVSGAPPEARAEIEAAFENARKRFEPSEPPPTGGAPKPETPPPAKRERRTASKAAPQPESQPSAKPDPQAALDARAAQFEGASAPAETPPFEYFLLDERGDLVSDDTYLVPLAWAEVFAQFYDKASLKDAMAEHNADAIADARAQDPAAALVLSILDPAPEPDEIAVIPLTTERGTANGAQYFRDMKAAADEQDAATMLDWLDAQRPTLETAAKSTKLMVIKMVAARFEALGLAAPEGFAPAAEADKDAAIAKTILEHLDSLTDRHAITNYANERTVQVPVERWTREKPAMATMILSAFAGRIEAVTQGG
jgi:hypothetical protein